MSAIVIPQAKADEGFGLLKDIVDMVKNPKAIDEAYERRRKAAQLSDDEVQKSEAARALIAQADQLRNEFEQKSQEVEKASIALNAKTLAHLDQVKGTTDKMQAWEDQLNSAALQQADAAKALENDRRANAKRATEIEDAHVQWQKQFDDRLSLITKTENAQKLENTRLAEWADKLKAKAARLAAEAQLDV